MDVELVGTRAADHGITGTGVDISTMFLDGARTRALEPGVADQVAFVHCLPGLVSLFQDNGYVVVEMVLADEDSWDRYAAAQWRNIRTLLDAHPDDGLAPELREELSTAPLNYVRYPRPPLGWGVFGLVQR